VRVGDAAAGSEARVGAEARSLREVEVQAQGADEVLRHEWVSASKVGCGKRLQGWMWETAQRVDVGNGSEGRKWLQWGPACGQ